MADLEHRVNELLQYDPATGVFVWRPRETTGLTGRRLNAIRSWNTKYAGKTAGSLHSKGYIHIRFLGKEYKAHRLAWTVMTGTVPAAEIDHWNGVKSDNRWLNLRDVSHLENCRNRKARGNTTGHPGVAVHGNRFKAQLWIGKKNRNLGSFDTAEKAGAAYREAINKQGFDKFHSLPEHVRTLRGMTPSDCAEALCDKT